MRDRVVQAAAKLVLESIFEADFRECSYGFRPRRGATGALEAIRLHGSRGHRFVVEGGIRSPLLASICLHVLDETWERGCRHLGLLVRYADDFVVPCRTRAQADEALRRVREILPGMGLELHPEKTRVVELGPGREGFVFLGCYLRVVRPLFKGRMYLFRWPPPKAMNRVRARIRELTDRRRRAGMKDIRQVDRHVNQCLVRLVDRGRRGRPRPFVNREWPTARFVKEFGLHQLVGTIRCPGSAHAA